MNGIPVWLEIAGVRERFLFATRRRGVDGEAMAHAQRDFHAARVEAQRVGFRLQAAAQAMDGGSADIEAFDAQFAALAADARRLADVMLTAALAVVRLSLAENYQPEDIERILANTTDAQLGQLVGVIETGATPADFFPRRDTQPNPSDTSPAGAGPSEPSLPTGSPGATSTPAT